MRVFSPTVNQSEKSHTWVDRAWDATGIIDDRDERADPPPASTTTRRCPVCGHSAFFATVDEYGKRCVGGGCVTCAARAEARALARERGR